MNCIQCGFQQLSIKTLSLQQPVARGGPGSCRRDPYYYGGNDRDFIEIKVSLVLLKTEKMLESQFEFPSFERAARQGRQEAPASCQSSAHIKTAQQQTSSSAALISANIKTQPKELSTIHY